MKRILGFVFLGAGSSTVDDLTATMTRRMAVPQNDGSILISGGGSLTSTHTFRPPVRYRIVALTDERDLRISYGARQIIFNWEMNPDMLRIDGGPASGKHKAGVGRLPFAQWAGIELTVLRDQMIIRIDGIERYRVAADFSTVNQPFAIRAHGGEVRINSVLVDKP